MFGLGIGKHKRALAKAMFLCFRPLKDDLGNVPIPMQTDPAINATILGVCHAYSLVQNISKPSDLAVIADAVFEELYRRESVNVQNRVDGWQNDNNADFKQAYDYARSKSNGSLELVWLIDYAKQNFEPGSVRVL